jgi:hypothetical protein
MRNMVFRGALMGGLLLTLASSCEPLPIDAGQYWTGHDAGLGPGTAGAGGTLIDPTGAGGYAGGAGTGDVTGAGGTDQPGGTTGNAGVGPGAAGSLGAGGTGDLGGTTGAGAAGGETGRGGFTGTAGVTGAGGRGGSGAGGLAGAVGAAGRGGSSGTTGGAGTSGALTGMLTVSVTTKAAGGRYQPDNVGAIWIADANTRFVKSLYVWGQQRRRELARWTSATSAAGLANNLVDAVTAATMHGHGLRMASWNGTDANRALVPDGAYKVCFELEDGAQQYQCVDFTKSRSSQTLMPANTTSFTSRTIGYTP